MCIILQNKEISLNYHDYIKYNMSRLWSIHIQVVYESRLIIRWKGDLDLWSTGFEEEQTFENIRLVNQDETPKDWYVPGYKMAMYRTHYTFDDPFDF